MKKILYESVLPKVQKPARYCGGEYNQAVMKDEPSGSFLLAFPDTYEVGMSHLGMKILYSLINETTDFNCERVFAPAKDMADELKAHNLPLYSLESFSPVNEFDFIGFSLQYEMCLTNVLYMLDLGKIPLTARERANNSPLIVAGGPCCVNPEPFCEFFDIIVIGEAEEVIPKMLSCYDKSLSKAEYLEKIADINGIYIPEFYKLEEDECGILTERAVLNTHAPKEVKRAFVADMDKAFYPDKFIVPFTEIVHDRIMQEVMRGCPRGCRFCQAGSIYRPMRSKSAETVKEQILKLINSTGYEEVSLSSLSTTDYPHCDEILEYVMKDISDKKVSATLPSLRIDRFSVNAVKLTQSMRTGTLTFAPEAGSQRMRDIINKNISEEDIFNTLSAAFENGFSKFKLYFMIGLPGETDEDVIQIAKLSNKIHYLQCERVGKGRASLSISVANFVPKPFTPFEFFGQNTAEQFRRKHLLIKENLTKRIKYSYHDSSLSVMEAAFARGDRRLNAVIKKAYENGCVFDSWQDYYNEQGWLDAFSAYNLSYEEYACRKFDFKQKLPWDFIDIGVDKSFYIKEYEKSERAELTPPCFERCSACGINKRYGRCECEIQNML